MITKTVTEKIIIKRKLKIVSGQLLLSIASVGLLWLVCNLICIKRYAKSIYQMLKLKQGFKLSNLLYRLL